MESEIKLTKLAKCAGCGAKMGAATLSQMLDGFKTNTDADLLVGFDRSDDACVYALDDKNVLIETADFFPPIVDNPYLYGQIAAANALSDVYAMGGTPKLALNLLCTPENMDSDTVREILRGGYDKVYEAGAVIAGGHSIHGAEPLYGLCVTGFGSREKIWKNAGAMPGDKLILTKALGVGIVTTAAKADLCTDALLQRVYAQMSALNKGARDEALPFSVHACTDVTGFSLMGHSFEIAQGSGCTLHIQSAKLPIIPEALEFAAMGFVPAGAYRNRDFTRAHIKKATVTDRALEDILYDPQTSGGLLFAVPQPEAKACLNQLKAVCPDAAEIGYVTEQEEYALVME